jgi:hypothetical protein
MSVEKNRRVTAYPPPRYSKMVKALALIDESTESKIASQAIKNYFDNLPSDQKQRVILAMQKVNY